MNKVIVTFDRVFDIVRRLMGSRMPCTEFGFQNGDTKKYGITAPGLPRIEAGMTVTAVLRRPDDWQTLIGWVDHETGEIACRSPMLEIGGFAALLIGAIWAHYLMDSHSIVAGLVLVLAISLCVGGVVRMREAMLARRFLRRIRATLRNAAPGTNI